MPTFTLNAAKKNLAKLVVLAEAGEEVIIARGKRPVAKIVPVAGKPNVSSGALKARGRSFRNSSDHCLKAN
jgi:antitoxin (DNA-binding transcriptional repressor) of toxin-antitoxin stability system